MNTLLNLAASRTTSRVLMIVALSGALSVATTHGMPNLVAGILWITGLVYIDSK